MKKKLCLTMAIVLMMSMIAFTGCGSSDTANYPSETINVTVPYSAGGGSDTLARQMGASLEELDLLNGQSYVVTNVDGGGGSIGTVEVLNQEANGYNLLFTSITSLVGGPYAGTYTDKFWDEELTPVAFMTAVYYGLCTKADADWKSLDDFIAYAKENPGKISCAIAGIGGAAHIVGLQFEKATGIDLNFVPYDGAADVKAAVEGGHADCAVLATSESADYVEAGKFIQMAYSAEEPLETVEAPTFIEEGIDVSFTHRNGFMISSEAPQECIDYLTDAFAKISQDENYIKAIEGQAALVDYLGPDDAKAYLTELDGEISSFADEMK